MLCAATRRWRVGDKRNGDEAPLSLLWAMASGRKWELVKKYCGFQGAQPLDGVWDRAPEDPLIPWIALLRDEFS